MDDGKAGRVYQRGGLLVIGIQSGVERLVRIVRATFERFARHIVLHRFLGRMELFVVRSTGRFVDESTENASFEQIVIDLPATAEKSCAVLARSRYYA